MDAAVCRQLAEFGHRLWCDRAKERGWRPGARYDETARIHDALVEFDRLSPADQQHALLAIETGGIVERLVSLVTPDRSPTRLFDALELQHHPAVTWSGGIRFPRDSPHHRGERGRVESWEVDPGTGYVTSIRVRWECGELTEHEPLERELRRLDEPPQPIPRGR